MIKVNVLIQIPVVAVDQTYTYVVPFSLVDKIKVGVRVKVNFNNRLLEGFVMGFNLDEESGYELKEVVEVVDLEPILTKELYELGFYMQKTTLCTLISAYQSMLPKAYKASIKSKVNIKYDVYVKAKGMESDISLTKRQMEVYLFLLENKTLKKDVSSNILAKLDSYGLIEYIKEEVYRYKTSDKTSVVNTLIGEQVEVFNEINTNINKHEVYLMHGVTGSGKTEVYFNLINEVINSGKEVIFLVPEISITTQMIDRFTSVFGSNVAVLHSKLSDGARYDEYRKILKKEVSIVVGARSAIFAPFLNVGLIIVDEEHSQTYKQDNSPHYNAIDIGIYRAKYHNCPVVLGSATPTLESFARARKGVYKLVTLTRRINNVMPKIEIVDMKEEYKLGNRLFSSSLRSNLDKCLEDNKQAIILLNRRGYSTSVTCKSCGYIDKCPNCDISLTFHKTKQNMRCHYCGYSHLLKSQCPLCKSEILNNVGIGTQKLEEELIKLYPNARIVRMDLDTTSKKDSYKKIIDDFYNSKYDILIGTQMISKGLDFPNVVLVGIVNADSTLNIPDFRNGELNYQLLSQTSGRAGRGEDAGKVVIQTFNKDHYSIVFASNHDYLSFYEYEMNIRKRLGYPPYYFICVIRIKSKDFNMCFEEGNKIVRYLKQVLDKTTTVLGPVTANVVKVDNVFNVQILIKYKKDEKLLSSLNIVKNKYKTTSKINIDIDIKPNRV